MDMKYFDKDLLRFLFPQRTRLTTEYGLSTESSDENIRASIQKMVLKDFNMIKDYLPNSASDILDIGCGLGLINIALNDLYSDCNFHLLDKTQELNTEKISGFNEKYTFYNSLPAAKTILNKNGIDENRIHLYEVEDENIDLLKTKKFDVILSFLSCGWHYSVEVYRDLILSSLADNGIVILDIRHNTNDLDRAKDFLELIECVVNTAESKHTGGTIGDRYIFKKK